MEQKRRFIRPDFEAVVIEGLDSWGPKEIRKQLGLRMLKDYRADALELRPMPEAALRLAELARDPDPDIEAAIATLQRDPALASRVLKLASTPAFSRKRPPRDLKQAAYSIGIHRLRDLAFATAMGRVFRCPKLDKVMKREIDHGFRVGLGTSTVFSCLGIGGSQGFLCGMLHDVGNILTYAGLAQYAKEDPAYLEPLFVTRVRKVLHAALGEALLQSWGLGETVRSAARHHHEPSGAGALMQVALAVAVADYAEKLEVNSVEERHQALQGYAQVYQAGLSDADVLALAKAVDPENSAPVS